MSESDIEALISVRSARDARNLRARLIRFIWGRDTLPTELPDVQLRQLDARLKFSNAAGADRLVVNMQHGFTSTGYLIHPKAPNGSAVVFHQGHTKGRVSWQADVIDALLSDGHTVALLSMPLDGLNYQAVEVETGFGRLRITGHNQLQLLRNQTFEPTKLFVHPTAVTVNYLVDRGFKTISLYGISGGGWIVTLYAALDPRPQAVFPVAGSIPLYLRGHDPHDGWGDQEQYDPALLRIADYLDLYVLGAIGRRYVQVLNQFDTCCFGGTGSAVYAPIVSRRVSALNGSYDLFLDGTHQAHELSPTALRRIHQELRSLQNATSAAPRAWRAPESRHR